ncbi:hypothetical protein KY290_025167 [Solanum tuberosum]|uniref:Integrase core domain containing protein n=1 Tax=Solanum tuberosum TaxID=4113 RepID=A0ABQ7UUT6_SOLTU|nr:hypothetical protein KY284_023971 [Solanum tuberosum]KAH0754897.1 hypothetical protein KY290_025167 [Solanum tuberosum]
MDSDKDTGWVIYYGATDYMTFDQSLLQAHYKPHRSHVSNANGVSSQFQDLNIKEIIGRGTKRRGLYYVDDVCRAKIKVLRSDNGGEYVNQVLQSSLQNHGINQENIWLSSTTPDQGILNQTVQQESEESPSPVPLVPTNNVPSDDVPEVCVTFEETTTNNLIDDTTSVVSSDDNRNRYQLPRRINRGKAPARYFPDNPKEVKYPIAHYVPVDTFQALSKAL